MQKKTRTATVISPVIDFKKVGFAQSDFLTNMSYELRTPLNAILGFAQLLETDSLPLKSSQKASVEQILQAGWYMLEFINNIIEVALSESGKISLSFEPVSLRDVLLDCQKIIEPLAQKRNISIHFPLLDKPYFVKVDHTRIKQILVSLLSNAIKYNRPEGSVDVTYSIINKTHIRLIIRDTGHGLSSEKLEQLFEPFNRLGQESSGEAGVGIDLVMSKLLVELMGGNLGVESTVDIGSVFWFEFALTHHTKKSIRESEVVELSTGIARKEINNVSAKESKPKLDVHDIFNAKILIVDDQEANVLLLDQMLHEAGYTSISFTMNPYAVNDLNRKNHYDLILLDLQMPGMDGFHIMENLKQSECDGYLPVIVISAHEKYRVRALQEGAKDFISKPFNLSEVLMRIYNMLEVRLLHKESKNYSLKLEKVVRELRETESNLLSAEGVLSKEKAVLNENMLQLREANATLVSNNIEAHTLTKKMEEAKVKMTHLAQHDALTGLPNRLLLNDRLAQMVSLADRQNKLFAVMFLDLDYFKLINDEYGHSIGDKVLQVVARRLLACVRHSDTVCRQGGDEFVILLTDIEQPECAVNSTKSVAKKILKALTTPYLIDGLEMKASVSIGISMYPDNGLDADTLIKNADTAMYRAKEAGRDSYQFFE